jgi:N-acetylmuramoyl-L-alanine amidase
MKISFDAGHNCTPYGLTFSNVAGSLQYRCDKANSSGSEFHGCIHFNFGGGEGVEVYAISEKGKDSAE